MQAGLDARRLLIAAMAAIALFGCDAELQHDLTEAEANEIVVLLGDQGVAASKTRDGGDGEGWMVEVPSPDRARAWRAMQQAGLPRRAPPGFNDLYPRAGLLPSPDEERVLLQAATAGELERSLMRLDGVLDARVHLVMPARPRLSPPGATPDAPRASVLLRMAHGARAEPLAPDRVAALVAGAVDHLQADRVEVLIESTRPAAPTPPQETWAALGPLRVAPDSLGLLRGILAAAALLVLLTAAALTLTLVKLRRLRPPPP